MDQEPECGEEGEGHERGGRAAKGEDFDGGQGKGRDDRGKGRGYDGGKGKRKGKGPADTDTLPAARRDELRAQLEAFAAGAEPQLRLPSTINGLERKLIHELAGDTGLTSQSFGKGADRYLCVFKASAGDEGFAEAGHASGDAEKTASGGADSDVIYSSIVLSKDSQRRLKEFCATAFNGGIPAGWTVHCEHMTVCVGPLSRPRTEDNRSVADAFRAQIGGLANLQPKRLKVVSVGWDDNAMAVGVLGCVSCNRNPHITVATAPGRKPNESNAIRQWDMLAPEAQIDLEGLVWQRGGNRASSPPPSAFAAVVPARSPVEVAQVAPQSAASPAEDDAERRPTSPEAVLGGPAREDSGFARTSTPVDSSASPSDVQAAPADETASDEEGRRLADEALSTTRSAPEPLRSRKRSAWRLSPSLRWPLQSPRRKAAASSPALQRPSCAPIVAAGAVGAVGAAANRFDVIGYLIDAGDATQHGSRRWVFGQPGRAQGTWSAPLEDCSTDRRCLDGATASVK